jgi:hypothetical protein
MQSVRLFGVRAPRQIAPAKATIESPLGVIELSLAVDAVRVGGLAPDTFEIGAEARVLVWDLPELRAELLITPVTPDLPPGATVAGCVGALWRVQATSAVNTCIFDARRAAGGIRAAGGPASGQALAAFTWDDQRTEVSLGTPDAEGLGRYEHAGLQQPAAWRSLVGVEDPTLVFIEEFLPDGLRVHLPGVGAREVGQTHFAVAWADLTQDDDASWFAVDLLPSQILSALGAAL